MTDLGDCIKDREHCWHARTNYSLNPIGAMLLCCWCARWQEVPTDHLIEHGPWRAKLPHSGYEVKDGESESQGKE